MATTTKTEDDFGMTLTTTARTEDDFGMTSPKNMDLESSVKIAKKNFKHGAITAAIPIRKQHLITNGQSFVRLFELEKPLLLLRSDSVSLPDILSSIVPSGPIVMERINERINIFNDIAAEMGVKEIKEDILKLLADAQLLLSSLGEKVIMNRMKNFLIPTWDSLFILIEKYVMQNTYDMVYFKICKECWSRDERLAKTLIHSSMACISSPTVAVNQHVAANIFKHLEVARPPADKIKAIEKAIKTLMAETKNLSSDDLIPLIIVCLIRSQAINIFSNLKFITEFSFEKRVELGSTGFLLSSIEGATTFLEQYDQDLRENSEFHITFRKALANGDLDEIKRLVDTNPKPRFIESNLSNLVDDIGNNAVFQVLNHLHIVQYFLLEKGYSTLYTNALGNSYFHDCAKLNILDTAKWLLENGHVNLKLKNKAGETPFSIACSQGHLEFAKLLSDHDSDLEKQIPVPLIFQSVHNVAVLEFLIGLGIEMSIFVEDKSILSWFCAMTLPEYAILLLKKGRISNLESQDNYGKTFLHYCSTLLPNDEVAETFFKEASSTLKQKVINMTDIDMNTPLHLAALHHNTKMVKLLLENGARKDVVNFKEQTPFEMTSDESVRIIMIKKLLLSQLDTYVTAILVSAPKIDSEQNLVFEIRSVTCKDPSDFIIVRRTLEDFCFFRSMIIKEFPESLLYASLITLTRDSSEIRDILSHQSMLVDASKSERGARLLKTISKRVEMFLRETVEKFPDHELICEFLQATEIDHEAVQARVAIKKLYFDETLRNLYSGNAPDNLEERGEYWMAIVTKKENLLRDERKTSDLCRSMCKVLRILSYDLLQVVYSILDPVTKIIKYDHDIELAFREMSASTYALVVEETKKVSNILIEQNHSLTGGMEGATHLQALIEEHYVLDSHARLLSSEIERMKSDSYESASNIDLTFKSFEKVEEERNQKACKINYVMDSLTKDFATLQERHCANISNILDVHVQNHIDHCESIIGSLHILLNQEKYTGA